MLQIVLNTIRKHDLIPSGSKVVVGVSGGADSLALLHVLHTLREQLDCQLHVATLDHGLRGDASAEDVRFVVEICQQWGIPVTAEKVDVAVVAQQSKQSIEVAARRARYKFFTQVAKDIGVTLVTVAHHANDQAETLLMRITRGTGTHGLQGMKPQSSYWEGVIPVTLIRPLLNITRTEIETYCQEHNLQARQDATNDDTDYTRNYIRHKIIPLLQDINPQVIRAINQLSDTAVVEQSFLESELQKIVEHHVVEDNEGRRLLPCSVFRELHPALQRRYMGWAAKIFIQEVDYSQIVNAVEVALSERTGAIAQFAGGIQLRMDYEMLVVEWGGASPELTPFLKLREDEIKVSIPSIIKVHQWHLEANVLPPEFYNTRLSIPEGANVILRTRRQGERFAPLGLNGHTQKLSEWMVDHKVPRAIRDNIPLLVVNGEVAAILYGEQWTISHHFAVREESKRVVYFAKY